MWVELRPLPILIVAVAVVAVMVPHAVTAVVSHPIAALLFVGLAVSAACLVLVRVEIAFVADISLGSRSCLVPHLVSALLSPIHSLASPSYRSLDKE